MSKKRLDELLIERELAEDKSHALALLMKGAVLVDGQKQEKPGTRVDSNARVKIIDRSEKFVSRGGLKLEAALDVFSIDVQGSVCIDLGASTGGFTDCLLKRGAARVFAFDVGKGQLHWALQQDPRVVVKDGFNVRFLTPSDVEGEPDLVTGDLSFISLRQIAPALSLFKKSTFLLLVKPQFEADRGEVEAGGVIRREELRLEILERVKGSFTDDGFEVLGESLSPIAGQKGNREYFLLLRLRSQPGVGQ